MIWWLAFEKKTFQFWREIWIQVVVILLQLYSHLYFHSFLLFLHLPICNSIVVKEIQILWYRKFKHKVIPKERKCPPVLYSDLYVYCLLAFQKNSHLYIFFQSYTFIIFKEISHPYFYSELSSIRNSRVFRHKDRICNPIDILNLL